MSDETEERDDEPTLRGAIEAAFDRASELVDTAATAGPASEAEQAAQGGDGTTAGTTETAEAATDTGVDTAVADGPGESAVSATEGTDDSANDEGEGPAIGQGAEEDEHAAVEATTKPPASWRPVAREEWGKLPGSVRDEIGRREDHINRVLEDTSGSHRMGEALMQAAAPYADMIVAEGSDPVTAARSMFQTAAVLKNGPPQAKAETLARIIQQYNIDVKALDEAIFANQGGAESAAGGATAQPARDPRIDGVIAQQERMQSMFQHAQQQSIAQSDATHAAEVDAFGETHEFLADVADDMSAMITASRRMGRDMTLDKAYDTAVSLRPEIAQVLKHREMARASGNGASKARLAASSVKGRPSGGRNLPEPADSRDALMMAWDAHS